MPTNGDRAEWAAIAVETYQGETGTDDEDAVADLLCDLMHLSDADHVKGVLAFDEALRRARFHYDAEINGEE
jgi:hypothetical protein